MPSNYNIEIIMIILICYNNNNNNIRVIIIPLNGGMKKGKRGGRAAAVLRSPASELQASAGGTPSHASPLLCTHRHHQVIVDNDYIKHTSENCLYFDRLDIYFPLFVT